MADTPGTETLTTGEVVERLRNARIVGEYWLDSIMGSAALRGTGMSHPVAMVMAALDGETDPVQMGIPPAEYANRLVRLRSEPIAKTGEVE